MRFLGRKTGQLLAGGRACVLYLCCFSPKFCDQGVPWQRWRRRYDASSSHSPDHGSLLWRRGSKGRPWWCRFRSWVEELPKRPRKDESSVAAKMRSHSCSACYYCGIPGVTRWCNEGRPLRGMDGGLERI